MAIFFFLVLVVRITIVQSKRQTRNENFRTDLILVCISVVMVNDAISSASSGGGESHICHKHILIFAMILRVVEPTEIYTIIMLEKFTFLVTYIQEL